MRLIDAEALYKRIPAYVCVPCTFSKEIDKDCKDCVVQRVMNIVDNFPTIDAVEVVHGEWVATRVEVDGSRFTGERCSRCGWWKSMGIYNYCPNCGAKMDGEVKKDEMG